MSLSISSSKPSLVREAYWAGWACRFMAAAIPVLLAVSWFNGAAQIGGFQQVGLDASHRLSVIEFALVLGLNLLPSLALSCSLLLMAKCFDCFVRGDWFGSSHPCALVSAGRWLVLAGVLTFIAPTLSGIVLTLNSVDGSKALVVSLSSNAVLLVLFGLLLWMLGYLWFKANALAQDNARYV